MSAQATSPRGEENDPCGPGALDEDATETTCDESVDDDDSKRGGEGENRDGLGIEDRDDGDRQ